MSGDEDWKLVTASDKKRVLRKNQIRYGSQSSTAIVEQSSLLSNGDSSGDDTLSRCIEGCHIIILKSDLWANLCSKIEQWMKLTESDEQIRKVVAYGIGNFSRTSASYYSAPLWQLSIALCLHQMINSDDCTGVNIEFFDPCTTALEKKFLQERFNVSVLETNDRGNHCVCNVRTIFLMPHCPSQLYENVIWSNFFNLEHIVLVGNSLQNLGERRHSHALLCLQSLLPNLHETALLGSKADHKKAAPSGNFFGAWNDTYVSYYHFPSQDNEYNLSSLHRPYESFNSSSVDLELL
jgi:SRR1